MPLGIRSAIASRNVVYMQSDVLSGQDKQESEKRVTAGRASRLASLEGESAAAVDVIGVKRSFGHVCAIDGLSLTVQTGNVVGIVGPNGAGKTTLIDMICGLVRPSEGTVLVLSENVVTAGAAL